MNEARTTIAEVPSGKVELVFNGVYSTIQFNCSCVDAWPYCHAMCCRLRTAFTVIVRKEEEGKFRTRPHPHSPHLNILQDKPEDGSCTYLEGTKCEVHESGKPLMCTLFHCSPGGVGEGVKYRDGGWLLSPFRLNENIDDDGTIVSLVGVTHG